MSMIKIKTSYLTVSVLCLMALSITASAVSDPDMISSFTRSNSTTTTPVLVKGGLTTGALPFCDRPALAFGDVSYMGGMDYIQTAVDDKADADVQYDVTVNKAGTLFLIIDNRVGDDDATTPPTLTSAMTWVTSMGFTQTSYTVNFSTDATVYSLPVSADQTVTLGAQNNGSTRVMYVIAAAPEGWDMTNQAPVITGISSTVATRISSISIDATITDDGIPATPGLSIQWETVSQPAGTTVTYSPSQTAEDVTIQLSALGTYVIQVTASDGDKAITRTIEITYAETFALQATDFVNACNDSNTGPTSTRRTTVIDVKNYNDGSAQRRRVGFCKYDISAVKTSGKVFANSYLTLNVSKWTSGASNHIYVYAIKEGMDDITLTGKTWNTMPGIDNNPAPDLNSEITIDTVDQPDVSPVLLAYSPTATNAWISTPTSTALDDVLNSDTDGNIVLMFIAYDPESNAYEIRSITNSTADTETGLKGIILRGEMKVPTWAYDPNPANNSTTNSGLSQLSWINPDPNLPSGEITCDVYFHEVDDDPNTSDDPNDLLPNYGYTVLATGISDNFVTLPAGTLETFKTYKWIVDIHDTTRNEMVQGYVWTFDTNNAAPTASAGADQYLWLNNNGDPNTATVNLDGTTSDDGMPSATYSVQWTLVSGPTVTISPDNQDDISVVLPQTGTYVFRLTADDGDLSAIDDVQIVVAANPCAAAQAMPGYAAYTGDLNNDCSVNLGDLVLFVADWLECSSLVCD